MLRVAVCDRDGFHLEAIKTLLALQPDLELAGAVSDFRACLEISATADVALIRQSDGPAETLAMISSLRSACPETRIVVFGAGDDPGTLLDYLEAGARGYASREDTSEHLLNVVRVAASGEALVGAHLFGALLDRLTAMRELAVRFAEECARDIELTDEQHCVARLIAAGLTDEEISAELGIPLAEAQARCAALLEAFDTAERRQAALLYRLVAGPPAASAKRLPARDT